MSRSALALTDARAATDAETWRPAGERAERVETLDVLRGLMALAVAVYHLGALTRVFSGPARSAVIVLGIYSVEGFFVISGFCFFHLYARADLRGAELWRFHQKRFLRIAPLYYAALVLTLVLEPSFRAIFTWQRLAENVTLSFGLFQPNHAFVIGGWSIGLEYVFYLFLPALLWIGRRRGALYVLTAVLIAWSLPYAFGKLQAAEDALRAFEPLADTRYARFNVYVQLPNHAYAFVFGGLIADLRARTPRRLPFLALIAALCVLACVAALDPPLLHDHFEAMVGFTRLRYAALCCLVVLLFAFARLPRFALAGPLKWLGELSYALYLMHPIAWLLLVRFAPPLVSPVAQLGRGLLAALVLAVIAHQLIELPALRYARRLGTRRATP